MGDAAFFVAVGLGVLSFGVCIFLAVYCMKLRSTYAPVLNVDEEIAKRRKELLRQEQEAEKRQSEKEKAFNVLEKDYDIARTVYEKLRKEVTLLEENLDDLSFGLYKPHYHFDDLENYKTALQEIYSKQKSMLRDNRAVNSPQDWTVNGSKAEGAKMVRQESKLMLRAFNAEVDAAIANVSWNNVTKMEERIRTAYRKINELGSVMGISITDAYLRLAFAELELTYEYEAKKQEIKEEQRRIREQMREEEVAQRQFEKAQKDAQAEEARYEKALAAARVEMEKASAEQAIALNAKVADLEQKLADAQAKRQQAVSMAQLTKCGHVYVISNVGSFGDDVYKIGMTRRLDPNERVLELGDASVPFPFDVHAMIYSTDAPGLESAFHREFTEFRVNHVNTRKEFFRITLDEIEDFARRHHAEIEFTKLAEAREYRETLSRLAERAAKGDETASIKEDSFPASLARSST
jgi:hypothetical protein